MGQGDILIIGASGILAPAAQRLTEQGHRVTGVARRHPVPPGVEAMHVDGSDSGALAAAIGDRRWSAAVVYEPAVSEASMRVVVDAVAGPVVRVRTSAGADPALGELQVPTHTLQLGWRDDESGTRWHRPDEISEAALQVLADGAPCILGVVRPWSRRP
jgi:hypothetical protein